MTMKGADILRLVDSIHRGKNIDKEAIFNGLETALVLAAKKKRSSRRPRPR